ncbi:MAG TPA: hypothetical protein DCR14_17395 [Acidimicrobiaceae bacterium]|nr:hypothetical protein [Acidimicrobiaceae bacterium]
MEPLSGAYPWSHEYSYHVFSDCYTGPNSGPIPAVVGGPQGVQQLFDIEVTSNGSTGSGEYTAIDNMNTATWDISRA